MTYYYLYRYEDEPIGSYWLSRCLPLVARTAVAEIHRMYYLEPPSNRELGYSLNDIDPSIKKNITCDLASLPHYEKIQVHINEKELSPLFFRQIERTLRISQ